MALGALLSGTPLGNIRWVDTFDDGAGVLRLLRATNRGYTYTGVSGITILILYHYRPGLLFL